MKIAVATNDLKTVDAHFAGARNLAVYDVTPDGYRLVEAIRFDNRSNEDGVHADIDEDRITPRVDAVRGCALLFVLAIGGPAAAQVVSRKIHPVKVPRPEPIADVLERVQTMLSGSPPPWLRKAMTPRGGRDLDFLEDGANERL
jgi:nitrogen fixation protein NifX